MLQLSCPPEDVSLSSPAPPGAVPNRTLAVLKFGSSVLRDHHDLPRVAGEIYRQSLRYKQLIVIVSAYAGRTDQLLSRFQAIAGPAQCEGCPDLVSLGEELTAAQLRVACSRIGLDAALVRPEQWGIEAGGLEIEAEPVRLPMLPNEFIDRPVLIVPGFVSLDSRGNRLLLGRGGSDFSAIYIGGELGAASVRLYKDVDGVYDHDPATGIEELHRFEEIDWDKCLEIARPLLQPHAIEYARAKSLKLEVGSIGTARPTIVANQARRAKTLPVSRPLAIGIAGFGVVGQALYQRLIHERDFHVSAILVRDPGKKREIYPPFELTTRLDSFREADFDVVIDVTCGEEAGFSLSCSQLQQGRALISTNKTVIEPWYEELSRLSVKQGGHLGISACVGGGTPILETIGQVAQPDRIQKVTAVLNGTVNFLLDQLAQGHSFEIALTRAQRAGFAEEDPAQDLSGADAETKLRLIARRAFNCDSRDLIVRRDRLTPDRIEKIRLSGERWIQLATIERAANCVIGSIGFVRAASIKRLPPLPGEYNFARIRLSDGEEHEVVGRGAGGAPTAEAIMTDLFACRDRLAASSATRTARRGPC
jgi:homoserine dehydrogenase